MEQATTRTILVIIQDGPYGTERAYNGLRLALQLSSRQAWPYASF